MNLPGRIDRLAPYVPMETVEAVCSRLGIAPDQIVKLDANENPYGPSPRARRALADLSFPHFYPDASSRALREGLAGFTGAPVESLLAGAGADELIDLLLRVLLEPGDRILISPPTFDLYAIHARLSGGVVVEVPRREGYRLDIPGLREAALRERPKAIFVGSPNNPDGGLAQDGEIEALLGLPALIVLDEAYIEFAGESGGLGARLSRIRQAAERENLAVLRTFSKWAGLAGLRVGYGAFPAWLAEGMWKAKQPYNLSSAASAAALATLEDLPVMAGRVQRVQAERERMVRSLGRIRFLKPVPSQANFVLCAVVDRSALEVQSRLLERGILVRAYTNRALPNHLRIAAGRPQDTARLIQALEEIE